MTDIPTYHAVNKMPYVLQMTLSFSWMKSFVFWYNFYQNLFLGLQLVITGSGNDLVPNWLQAITWTSGDHALQWVNSWCAEISGQVSLAP